MRYLYLFICFLIGLNTNAQIVIQSQNFNSPVVPALPAGYSQSGSQWSTTTLSPTSNGYLGASGSKYLRCLRGGSGTFTLTSEIFDATGNTGITITYGHRETSTSSNTYTLQWSDNGGTSYQTISSSLSATTSWSKFTSATLPASADNNNNIRIRIIVTGNGGTIGSSNAYAFDDLSIEGTPTNILEFYSKSSGFLNDLATWGSNIDGSGTPPIDFSQPDYIFHVTNNFNGTINGDLIIDGSGTTFTIEEDATFTIPAGFKFDNCALCTSIDIATNGTLNIANITTGNIPKFGVLSTGSTVNYSGAGNQTIKGGINYSNLILSGSGIKTCEVGQNVTVIDNFDLQSGVTLDLHKTPGNSSSFTLVGSSVGALGEIDANSNSIFIIDGTNNSSGNVRFKSGSLLGLLDFQATSTVLATESNLSVQQLRFSNPGNTSVLQILNNSKVTVSGEITGNPTFSGGIDAELEISGSGLNSFTLSMLTDLFDPTINLLKNFTLSRAITVTLGSEMKVSGNVDVQNGVIASNGNLTLNSDALGTGRILALNPPTADVTGNVNVQRFNGSGFTGWAMMANPTKTGTMEQFDDDIAVTCPNCPDGTGAGGSDFTSVYTYDETQPGASDDFASYIPINAITENFVNGTGYYVYFGDDQVNSNDITWDATGLIAKEEVRIPLFSTPGFNGVSFDDQNDGYNLVGNPYPAPIDWNEVFNATSTDMSNGADPIFNAYSIYSPDLNGGAGGYYVYADGTSETPGIMDDGIIPIGQAFFVQSQGPAPRIVDLVVTENAKSASNTAYYLKSGNTVSRNQDCRFTLTRLSDNKSVNSVVTFKTNATLQMDVKYDAKYMSPLPVEMSVNPKSMNFCTVLDNKRYSINAVPPLDGNLTLDLISKVGTAGAYSISASNLAAIPKNYCIDLYDKQTQTHHDLKSGDYNCYLATTDISRFVITFKNKPITLTTEIATAQCNTSNDASIKVKTNANGVFDYVLRNDKNAVVASSNNRGNTYQFSQLYGGKYKLEVSNGVCSGSSIDVEVKGQQTPEVAFELPQLADVSNPIVFNNTSMNADTYVWNFGDGETEMTSNSNVYSHQYKKAGTYKVTLEAKNKTCDDVVSISKYLKVTDNIFNVNDAIKVNVWKNKEEQLVIHSDKVIANGIIEVYNLLGQKILSRTFENNKTSDLKINDIHMIIDNQIGVVKIKTGSQEITKRLAL
jgi:hypothetical protein